MDAGKLGKGRGGGGLKTKEKETGRDKRLHSKSNIPFLRRRWSWHGGTYLSSLKMAVPPSPTTETQLCFSLMFMSSSKNKFTLL